MAIEYGRMAFIKLGKETTWGTPVATPVSNRVTSVSMLRRQSKSRKNNLSTSAAAFQEGNFDGFEETGGTIQLPMYYDGSGMLLYAAMGDYTTTGSDPYDHVFVCTLATPSLTIDVQRGSGSSEKFEGCKISSMNISCNAGEEMMMSVDIIAETAAARTTAITSSFGSGKSINHYNLTAAKLDYDGGTYDIRSFDLTLNNSIERRNSLGAKVTAEPQLSDIREVVINITADMNSNTIYTDSLTSTSSTATMMFINSLGNEFKIELENAYVRDYEDSVDTIGVLTRSWTFVGQADPSNEPLKISVKNGNTDAIGN